MAKPKRRQLPTQKNAENDSRGIPRILIAARTEPLNNPITLKLWSSVAEVLPQLGGVEFIRQAIIEKLQRIADKPTPAVCGECTNLTKQGGDPFCTTQVAFLQKKHLKQKWNCEYYVPKKGGKT